MIFGGELGCVEPMGGPVAGELAGKRRNMRIADLKAVYWFGLWKKHLAAKQFTWSDFLEKFRSRVGGRDLCDDEEVSPQELGRVLALTLAIKVECETWHTERGQAKGWTTRSGKAYSLQIRTIAPHDVTPDEVKRFYRNRDSKERAARRKAERNRERERKTMENMNTQQHPSGTYAEVIAWQKENTKAQCHAIEAAVGDSKLTASDLMILLDAHPRWRAYAANKAKFRQAILDKLDILVAKGRITNHYVPNPHGGKPIRVVRRANRKNDETELPF